MQKSILLPILVIVVALAACSDPTPTPETIAATSPPPANTPEPKATTAPTPTTPSTPRATSPLPSQGQEALLASLSEAEVTCIGQDPERLIAALTEGGPASTEEQARLTQCLDDDTVNQLFMASIIPVLLSVETSACILAALEVIDPRAVMTAGLEGDPQAARAGAWRRSPCPSPA